MLIPPTLSIFQGILFVFMILRPSIYSIAAMFTISSLLVPVILFGIVTCVVYLWRASSGDPEQFNKLLFYTLCFLPLAFTLMFALVESFEAQWSPGFQSLAKILRKYRQPIR
jgi:hypothetical protein